MGYLGSLIALGLVLGAAGETPAGGYASDYDAYMEDIRLLAAEAPALAEEQGKQAVLARYQDLLDTYPGYPRNIEVATRMAGVLEWSVPEREEKPDFEGALTKYLDVIAAYDADDPYMPTVKCLAARAAMHVAPEKAEALYTDMLQAYSLMPAVLVECHRGLGELAAARGDTAKAVESYRAALQCNLGVLDADSPDRRTAENMQQSAAAALLALTVQAHDKAPARAEALERVLAEIPLIEERYPDMAARFQETVRGQLSAQEEEAFDPAAARAKAQSATDVRVNAKGRDDSPAKGFLRRGGIWFFAGAALLLGALFVARRQLS